MFTDLFWTAWVSVSISSLDTVSVLTTIFSLAKSSVSSTSFSDDSWATLYLVSSWVTASSSWRVSLTSSASVALVATLTKGVSSVTSALSETKVFSFSLWFNFGAFSLVASSTSSWTLLVEAVLACSICSKMLLLALAI